MRAWVGLVTAAVVGLIVIGIVLGLLEANRAKEVVDWILNAGEFLVEPSTTSSNSTATRRPSP